MNRLFFLQVKQQVLLFQVVKKLVKAGIFKTRPVPFKVSRQGYIICMPLV